MTGNPVWPYPEGTLVLCLHEQDGRPARTGCVDHIFEIASPPTAVDWDAGWVQMAHCMVCDWLTAAVDARWWSRLPTDVDIKRCLDLMEVERERMYRAMVEIDDRAHGAAKPELLNFD